MNQKPRSYRGWTGRGWIFGDLLTDKPDDPLYYIRFFDGEGDTVAWAVDPKSVGESTGLKDKHGTLIYEGDIVYLAGYGNYGVKFPFIQLYEASFEGDIGEIIGNIYQNKDLLEAKS